MVLEIHSTMKATLPEKGSLFSQSKETWHPLSSQFVDVKGMESQDNQNNSHCGVHERRDSELAVCCPPDGYTSPSQQSLKPCAGVKLLPKGPYSNARPTTI